MKNTSVIVGVVALVVLFLGPVTQVFGCGCVSVPGQRSMFEAVTGELNRAGAVFTGKVVRFEWRKGVPNESRLNHNQRFGTGLDWETKVVIVKVDKWWKPSLPEEVSIFTDEVRMADGTGGNSSCNYTFVEEKGYLVFAYGPVNDLRTNTCSFTRPLEKVSKEFLDALGTGSGPVKFEGEKPQLTLDPSPTVAGSRAD